MKLFKSWIASAVLLSGFAIPAGLLAKEPAAPEKALANYVAQADDSYGWTKRRGGKLAGGDFVELTLTSQTWHDIKWRHQLFVFKPANVAENAQAILLIGGGRWSEELAAPLNDDKTQMPREAMIVAALATNAKAPVAILLHVPQQPILEGKVEDEIISYTFEQYLKTQDPTWPLLLPMTKSAVKAMDAIQEFTSTEWSMNIEGFTVTGASKRGWTTWLTAAIDPRVKGIAPMVIDMLNMGPQMKHQVATFGGFSEQIEDYTERGIQKYDNTPVGKALRAIVDPYSYRADLKQPKLILLGTNDRYWPLDALNLYWSDLVGDKYILYVPNNGHGLKDYERIVPTVAALHKHAAGEIKLPELNWQLTDKDGTLSLTLQSNVKPVKVSAWTANATTRDFRESVWSSTPIEAQGDGTYQHQISVPAEGFSALLGEAVFEDGGLRYYLSTNVKISPPMPTPAADQPAQ